MGDFFQIFEAFSEYLNFNKHSVPYFDETYSTLHIACIIIFVLLRAKTISNFTQEYCCVGVKIVAFSF